MPFRNREYKRLEDRIFQSSETQAVIKFASSPAWSLDKCHALYELALRALKEAQLLETAWACIRTEVVFKSRLGIPLGHPAAALLLDSGSKVVKEALAKALKDWTKTEQTDFFFGCVVRDQRHDFAKGLEDDYGAELKILIYEDGEIDPEL